MISFSSAFFKELINWTKSIVSLTRTVVILSLRQEACGHSRLMVSEWSEEEVLAWLREEGLEAVTDAFKSNNIDGEELLSLSKETLSSDLHIGKII